MPTKIADTSNQDTLITTSKAARYKWPIIGVVGVTSLVAILVYITLHYGSAEMSIARDSVRIATVTRGDLVRDLSVQGRVVAAVSPRLYSPAQGTVTFHVDAGDTVEIDQLLASIDSPQLTNELEQETSTLMRLELELERQRIYSKKQQLENSKAVDLAHVALIAAEREKRRADKAWAAQSISNIDFEKAQDELQNARLVHQHAVSDAALNKESLEFEVKTQVLQLQRQALKVDELKRRVDELSLRSPVNGIVGNLAVQQKNQVSENQDILNVVDLTEFELELAIPESYADDLAIGMQAEVSFNGTAYPATLITLSPEIINNQVTGRLAFDKNVQNQPQGLRQNQRLTTRILMESREDVLHVARGQFLESGGGRIAYVLSGDIAERRQILTGARSLSSVEIIQGVEEGEQLIVSSTERFNQASLVRLND